MIIIAIRWKATIKHLNSELIKKALYLGFMGNIIYFVAVVGSLKFSHPAIVALILGVSPIGISILGNYQSQDISIKSLIVPFCLTLVGLIFVNYPAFFLKHYLELALFTLLKIASLHLLKVWVFSAC